MNSIGSVMPQRNAGDRDGDHRAADGGLVLLLRAEVHGKRGGRQRKHHDREEAGHVVSGSRVAREEAGQVAVDHGAVRLGKLTEVEPEVGVEHVVQTDGEQHAVEEAIDCRAGRADAGEESGEGVKHLLDERPDKAEADTGKQRVKARSMMGTKRRPPKKASQSAAWRSYTCCRRRPL